MREIKQRSIGTSLLLSIITCGIYVWFWLANIINDICDLKDKPRTAGKDILLSIITCGLYGVYLFYRIGADIDDLRHERGLNSGSNGILFLVLSLFGLGIIAYALAQKSLNELY